MRIQTPVGLQAGTVLAQWRPDKDTVTVHKIAIQRGKDVIDVLASGQQFTVLRREANLEQSILDGRLTAILQPEGLQVGDILQVVMSSTSTDATFGPHIELKAGIPDSATPKRARLRVEWPEAIALRSSHTHLPEPTVRTEAGMRSAEWDMSDLRALVLPNDAPGRFQIGRQVEFTDFASWKDLAALMVPLYERASVISAQGPLRSEVERIRASSKDPIYRAQAALALAQDQVRYIALTMGEGGYVPASAEETWSRRFGDCKAKTALLLALLDELGIDAVPVAVDAGTGDGIDTRLPLVAQFNHVLVRATIKGQEYWMDGTRTGDANLSRLTVPAYGWGLPFAAGAKLVRMMPAALDRPWEETSIHMDARGGDVPAPTRIEKIMRGDMAIAFNLAFANFAGPDRDRALRQFWEEQYSRLKVKTVSAAFDRPTGEFRMIAEGDLTLNLKNGRYWVDVPTPGYKPDFDREPGPHQTAPFVNAFPSYRRTMQTILLPPRFAAAPLHDAEPIDRTLAGVRYRRVISKTGNTFTIESSVQTLAPEFSYAEARAAEKELSELDSRYYSVVLAAPTSAEVENSLATPPETAADYINRAMTLEWDERWKEAQDAYDHALKLEPSNRRALEGRGFARIKLEDLKGARSDFEAATKLGSRLPFAPLLAAWEAALSLKWPVALREVDKALRLQPGFPGALLMRAEIHRLQGKLDAALDDTAEVLKIDPLHAPTYLMRINMYRKLKKSDLALQEADRLMALSFQDPFGYVAAAKTYTAYGKREEARRAFDKAIATKAQPYIYLNRAESRPQSDVAGRVSDLQEALKLNPDPDMLALIGDMQLELGQFEAALPTFDKRLTADPKDLETRIHRGVAFAKLGKTARAEADFAFVRAEAENSAEGLAHMCRDKAMHNVMLESALVDCDRAISLLDRPDYLFARALTLMRLGRTDDAAAAFDKALRWGPGNGEALYGRALLWSLKGDQRRAAKDAEAALAINKGLANKFRNYGLVMKAEALSH